MTFELEMDEKKLELTIELYENSCAISIEMDEHCCEFTIIKIYLHSVDLSGHFREYTSEYP